jgi:hypothetical protein
MPTYTSARLLSAVDKVLYVHGLCNYPNNKHCSEPSHNVQILILIVAQTSESKSNYSCSPLNLET